MILSLAFGCSTAHPSKSPSSAGDDVQVQRSDGKPSLVRIARDGDPTWALAAVVKHAGNSDTSLRLAEALSAALADQGFAVVSRAFPSAVGLVFSFSKDTSLDANPIDGLRKALTALPTRSEQGPSRSQATTDWCGTEGVPMTLEQLQPALGSLSTVLAVVGNASAVQQANQAYAKAGPWPAGVEPQSTLPATNAADVVASASDHELVVAMRTPHRARVANAARLAGSADSTLALLASSYPPGWRLVQTHSSFLPGGGCVAVRLSASESQPLFAARTANAMSEELDWILNEQVADEDPRLSALEASTPEEAALRAAWTTLTAQTPIGDTTSTFVRYSGPPMGRDEWTQLLAAKREEPDLPLLSRDEPGQGRVWALLVNPCATLQEDTTDAGHAALALSGAVRASSQSSDIRPWISPEGLGLLGTDATRTAGAEDRLAEDIARVVLRFARDSSGIVTPRTELLGQQLELETWDLALRLATGGHPSWLVPGPTQTSLTQLGPLAANRALRRFAAGALQLAVLSNQGASQSERLRQRVQHLLAGLRETQAECAPAPALSAITGEYEIDAREHAPAVLVYTTDAKFAGAVRELARLLNAPGGWLAQSFNSSALIARARAIGLGSSHTLAALGFSVSAETPEALEQALAQVRSLVARLSWTQLQGGPPATAIRSEPPIERLAELLAGDAAPLQVEALLSTGLTEKRLVVVKPRPIEAYDEGD